MDGEYATEDGNMKYWITGIILAVLAVAVWYFLGTRPPAVEEAAIPPRIVEQAPQPATGPGAAPAETAEPPAAEVVPAPEPVVEEIPLPELAASDGVALATLAGLAGGAPLGDYLAEDAVISRIVATIDALGGRRVPDVIQAVRGPDSDFLATAVDQADPVIRNEAGDPLPQYAIDPANYTRYAAYVELLEAVDPAEAAAAVRSYRPLLDEAYRQLGYPEGNFDQRLRTVIDELLAAPEPRQPIRLIKPEAYYVYADQELEVLSAGPKALLRMGPDNAARVKAWLTAFRDALVNE
jgi:hypothetical protein